MTAVLPANASHIPNSLEGQYQITREFCPWQSMRSAGMFEFLFRGTLDNRMGGISRRSVIGTSG